MHIEKLETTINGREYIFTVEIMPSEDGNFYRVTPDQEDEFLVKTIPTFIGFDEKGNVDMEEKFSKGESKEVIDSIWRAIKEQIINEHPSFSLPPVE
jgi:hypothetical protein